MLTRHDYAGCPDAACQLSESYGLGWAHGKVKMADELLALAGGTAHPSDCGCRPCGVLRGILRRRGIGGRRDPERQACQGRRDIRTRGGAKVKLSQKLVAVEVIASSLNV